MGCHHDATALSVRTHCHFRAVIERPHESTFWAAELLIRGQGESELNLGSQEQLLVFATHDKWQSCQIREGSSRAIQSVEPQQHTLRRKLIHSKVVLDLGSA